MACVDGEQETQGNVHILRKKSCGIGAGVRGLELARDDVIMAWKDIFFF